MFLQKPNVHVNSFGAPVSFNNTCSSHTSQSFDGKCKLHIYFPLEMSKEREACASVLDSMLRLSAYLGAFCEAHLRSALAWEMRQVSY